MLERGNFLQEIFSQQVDILSSLPKRRQVYSDHVQAIEKVLPKLLLSDLLLQRLIGGGDNSDICFDRGVSSYSGKFTFLQNPENLALDR